MIRKIIIHAHIFKNAGSTFDWILNNSFGSRFLADYNDKRMAKDESYLFELLDEKTKLCALSSHSVLFPIAKNSDYEIYPIVFLRDPLLRVRSVYDFERQQSSNTPGAKMAKKLDFPEYVKWRLREDVGATIRDFQVRFLTSSIAGRGVGLEQRFEYAKQSLEDNECTGIVERFDESVSLISHYLHANFPDFNVAYRVQNVTNKLKLPAEQIVSNLREDLGEDLFRRLEQANVYDIQLYNYAKSVFDHRLNEIA